MYNSNFKYYAKMLLGRKNEMWHFDNWARKYASTQGKALKIYSDVNSGINFEKKELVNKNPLFKLSCELRDACIIKNLNFFKDQNLKVALHIPPIAYSPAANSFFCSLKSTLEHMGILVYSFWDDFDDNELLETNYVFGIGAEYVTNFINWDRLNSIKKKAKFKILLQASFDILNKKSAIDFINYYKLKGVDSFFSFDFEYFNHNSGLSNFFAEHGTQLLSIPFSANPLVHFPLEYDNKIIDYTYVGSINYDKIYRYNQYFPNIINSKYSGLIIGPGWPWSKSFKYNVERDRLIYAHSKVALNLHLEYQININGQLNERAYILTAFGIPQVIDKVLDIEKNFPEIGTIADTPEEYINLVTTLVNNPEQGISNSKKAMIALYASHTSFHRVKYLFDQFKSIGI